MNTPSIPWEKENTIHISYASSLQATVIQIQHLKNLSFLHVWVGEDINSRFNSVTETKSVPKHLFPLISFNICGQSPTQITPPLPIYTIGAWMSFSTGPKMHQDVKQFIKPSTRICERELRSIFKMMGISSLAQNYDSFKSTHLLHSTPESNTDNTEAVIHSLPQQPPFYQHSFLFFVKSEHNANRKSSVSKHRKDRTDFGLLLL